METLAWLLGCNEKTVRRHVLKLEELGLVEKLERLRRPDGTFRGYKYRLSHIARAAERVRERKKANQERYEEKKREQEEARERKRKRRLSHRRERDASRLLDRTLAPGLRRGGRPPKAGGLRAPLRERAGGAVSYRRRAAPRHATAPPRARGFPRSIHRTPASAGPYIRN